MNKTTNQSLDKVRVIGIFAHVDAGKTTTSEGIRESTNSSLINFPSGTLGSLPSMWIRGAAMASCMPIPKSSTFTST